MALRSRSTPSLPARFMLLLMLALPLLAACGGSTAPTASNGGIGAAPTAAAPAEPPHARPAAAATAAPAAEAPAAISEPAKGEPAAGDIARNPEGAPAGGAIGPLPQATPIAPPAKGVKPDGTPVSVKH